MPHRKKINPRIWMGVCSAVGYAVVMGVKVYAFGWEGVPRFWIYAGVAAILILIVAAMFHRGRDRKGLKEAIARSAQRPSTRPGPADQQD